MDVLSDHGGSGRISASRTDDFTYFGSWLRKPRAIILCSSLDCARIFVSGLCCSNFYAFHEVEMVVRKNYLDYVGWNYPTDVLYYRTSGCEGSFLNLAISASGVGLLAHPPKNAHLQVAQHAL